MTYLIGQIIWFLILTAVLWGAIGWWMRSVSHNSEVRVLKADYDARQQALIRARDDLRDQLEQVAATRGDGQLSASARTRITEHVRTLERDNAKSREHLNSMATRLEALQATAAEREKEYNKLRQRLAEATSRLRATEQTTAPATSVDADAAQDTADQQRELEQLRRRVAAAEAAPQDSGQQEHARLLSVIQAQKRTIEQLNKRPQADAGTGTTGEFPAAQEASALRAALRARDAEIASLRKQLSGTPRVANAASEGTSQDLFSTPPMGLLTEPDGQPDDLKRINGIGPVLEARLNELGVFHFHQIAGFSDEDIGWIASQINAFPNRILRDRWVDQATSFLRAD